MQVESKEECTIFFFEDKQFTKTRCNNITSSDMNLQLN